MLRLALACAVALPAALVLAYVAGQLLANFTFHP